jgi:hypothetical protein
MSTNRSGVSALSGTLLWLAFPLLTGAKGGCGGSIAVGSGATSDAAVIDTVTGSSGSSADHVVGDASVGSGPKCGASPIEIVDFNTLARTSSGGWSTPQMALDAANLYFPLGDALMRVPIRGGDVSTLATFATPPGLIQQVTDPVVISSNVFLHETLQENADVGEQILRVPTQGGSLTSLATSNGQIAGFAVDEDHVYFADDDGVKSVPQSGGGVQLLSDAIGNIAIVGANVVVTSGANVLAIPVQGGAPTTLATGQDSPSFPLTCGSDACWYMGAGGSPMGPSGAGYIAHLSGNGITTVSAIPAPWSLVFDGTDFFETVLCDVCPGTLVRIPASGAPAVTMATGTYVVVDDECAYFSVTLGFNLPSNDDAGFGSTGIYSVQKSFAGPDQTLTPQDAGDD